jgi:uncharacterized membrane protein YkoI
MANLHLQNWSLSLRFPPQESPLMKADLWLDGNGDVLKEIDLPASGRQPEKARIISFGEACRIGRTNHLKTSAIELGYSEKEDSIVWRLKQRGPDGVTHQIDISAHSGAILNSVQL